MLPNLTLTLANGSTYPLSDYTQHVILVVNTATRCGFARQFSPLEQLYQRYQLHHFVVLGFPCDQFAHQEPLEDSELPTTCQLNYGVTFPLHQKCEVNGSKEHPLFTWLKHSQSGFLTPHIKWNFTKFLIDRQGNVIKRYAPHTSIDTIAHDVERLINIK